MHVLFYHLHQYIGDSIYSYPTSLHAYLESCPTAGSVYRCPRSDQQPPWRPGSSAANQHQVHYYCFHHNRGSHNLLDSYNCHPLSGLTWQPLIRPYRQYHCRNHVSDQRLAECCYLLLEEQAASASTAWAGIFMLALVFLIWIQPNKVTTF